MTQPRFYPLLVESANLIGSHEAEAGGQAPSEGVRNPSPLLGEGLQTYLAKGVDIGKGVKAGLILQSGPGTWPCVTIRC